MASLRIASPLKIGSVTAKNRICVPPMVLFGHCGEDGMVTEGHLAHYAAMAKGGPGLIIQEATCVTKEGRLSNDQLGIWSDDHIPGLKRLTEIIHREDVPVFLQIHHAGIMSPVGPRVCPDSYVFRQNPEKEGQKLATRITEVRGEKLTVSGIQEIRDAFIAAGRRAHLAGYDGVELHGCHSYLLCQFLNKNVNRREDKYAHGLTLIREIFEGIRAVTPPDFVIGIRLGAFEPTLTDAIHHAKALEEMGLQFLDVSYGFSGEMDFSAPGDETMLPVIRAAGEIRKAVSLPVFAVDSILTPEMAEKVVSQGYGDMADVGRSVLVDYNWTKKALSGKKPGACIGCKSCQWRKDPERCPGRIRLRREEEAK